MAHRKTLAVITILILIALLTIQPWRSAPAASQAHTEFVQQDPPTVFFERASLNVVEPDAGEDTMITIGVRVSQAPAQGEAVQVTVKSANGNALAGEDYLPVSKELIFPVGSTDAQVFEVAIFGNNANQADRAFVVFLTNPGNGTVGIPAAVTVYILDNDVGARNFLPLIRGHAAGPTPTPFPTTPTVTPCPYPTSP